MVHVHTGSTIVTACGGSPAYTAVHTLLRSSVLFGEFLRLPFGCEKYGGHLRTGFLIPLRKVSTDGIRKNVCVRMYACMCPLFKLVEVDPCRTLAQISFAGLGSAATRRETQLGDLRDTTRPRHVASPILRPAVDRRVSV